MLVAADGTAFAVRGADGRLAMVKSGSDTFAFREWLAADADCAPPKDKALGEGIRCDEAGCVGRLARRLARRHRAHHRGVRGGLPPRRAGRAERARGAARLRRTGGRPADVWQHNGALALRRVGQGFEMTPSRPAGYDRPWARARPCADRRAADGPIIRRAATAADATPSTEDLEPGD